MVADLPCWFSDQNLDRFEADGQRTHPVYMEILSRLSMARKQYGSVLFTLIFQKPPYHDPT